MNRKEFIKLSALLGLGMPIVGACGSTRDNKSNDQAEKFIVIGAGAAGLTTAYLLTQKGIEVEVLEASKSYGGRMKRTTEFADFPIPTGAEWLHTNKNVLSKIVNDSAVEIEVKTKPYNYKEDFALVEGKKTNLKDLGFTIDQKFIGSTWFDFYEQYIVPSIKDKIKFQQVVNAVDYGTEQVTVTTSQGEYKADKVIITVPVSVLQSGAITFTPSLPESKRKAIARAKVWGGCKAFIEFSEQFYPTITGFNDEPETAGHRLYYDAAYGQGTDKHILGLFAVGDVADPYLERNGKEQIQYILNELDKLYDGQASKYYVKHIFQNWSKEPFAQGAYVHYYEDQSTFRELKKPVANKIYFAGDAYNGGLDFSSVHAAALSAKKVVNHLSLDKGNRPNLGF